MATTYQQGNKQLDGENGCENGISPLLSGKPKCGYQSQN